MKNEPVLLGGLVTGLVTATLALLIAFGVELDATQQAAILGFVTALIGVVAFVVRSKTFGPVTVREAMRPSPEELPGGGLPPGDA